VHAYYVYLDGGDETQIKEVSYGMAMQCSRCGLCCHKTEMMLSKKDIRILESRGHSKKTFLRIDKQGYAKLKNRKGHCIFFDANKIACLVYADRPRGCRVYPVIVSEDEGIIVDGLCPMRKTITATELNLKGKEVKRLLKTIDREARERTCHD
jgi:uncharacterized protein